MLMLTIEIRPCREPIAEPKTMEKNPMKKVYEGLALLVLAGILTGVALVCRRANQPIIKADEAKHPLRTTRLFPNNLQKGVPGKEAREDAIWFTSLSILGEPLDIVWLAGHAGKSWVIPQARYNSTDDATMYLTLPEIAQLQTGSEKLVVHPSQQRLVRFSFYGMRPGSRNWEGYWLEHYHVAGNYLVMNWRYYSQGKDSYTWGEGLGLALAFFAALAGIILLIAAGAGRVFRTKGEAKVDIKISTGGEG